MFFFSLSWEDFDIMAKEGAAKSILEFSLWVIKQINFQLFVNSQNDPV